MTRLQVETADFRAAATTLRHDVAESVRICLEGLVLSSELVGDDPAGAAWSGAYDPAAQTVLRPSAQIVNAARTFHPASRRPHDPAFPVDIALGRLRGTSGRDYRSIDMIGSFYRRAAGGSG